MSLVGFTDQVMEVNFVSCLSWVKSGVAKTTPDVIAVNTEDLKKMIDEAKIRQNGRYVLMKFIVMQPV